MEEGGSSNNRRFFLPILVLYGYSVHADEIQTQNSPNLLIGEILRNSLKRVLLEMGLDNLQGIELAGVPFSR